MYYSYRDQPFSKLYQLDKERVHEIQSLNKKGKKPPELIDYQKVEIEFKSEEEDKGFVDVTGQIELPPEEKKRRRRGGRNRSRGTNLTAGRLATMAEVEATKRTKETIRIVKIRILKINQLAKRISQTQKGNKNLTNDPVQSLNQNQTNRKMVKDAIKKDDLEVRRTVIKSRT